MRKRGTSCQQVFFRLSVTLEYFMQTATDIVELLSRPGRPITLFRLDALA